MIAPRKKLWSTPDEVMLKAMDLLELSTSDTLYDIGCGDGRFLIQCCKQTEVLRMVGVEIDTERAAAANKHIHDELGISEERLEIICGNALEQDYSSATKIFLYLTERGLRLIYPIIMDKMTHPVTIVTYMAPFQANCPVAASLHCRVKTTKHPVGEWPLYLYHFDPSSNSNVSVPSLPPTVDASSIGTDSTPTAVPDTVFKIGD